MSIILTSRMKPGVLIIFMLLLMLIAPKAEGQEQDFRTWWEVDISKDLTNDLQASLDFSQRFRANSLRYDRTLLTAGLEYELFKNFEIDAGYRFYILRDDWMNLATKYRIHGDLSYSVDIAAFEIQFRERVQYGFNDFSTIEDFADNKLTNRNKLSLEYDLFASPFTLFGSYELFTDISNISALEISDHRVELGVEYALTFKSKLGLSYMFDREVNKSNPLTAHVIVIGFGYDL
ncbi:MAG: DUF2490 domain-containing protein [Bacteroidales bacterium]|nr:DUF2490 domain-containing protein [Bacteroidales bacterium]MDT8432644.1 DUF2490 domain-containing protein [Bacteroidales bacterium]